MPWIRAIQPPSQPHGSNFAVHTLYGLPGYLQLCLEPCSPSLAVNDNASLDLPQPMSTRQHALCTPTSSIYPCLASPIVRDPIVWAFRVDTRLRISLSEQSGQGGFEGWGRGHQEVRTPLPDGFQVLHVP